MSPRISNQQQIENSDNNQFYHVHFSLLFLILLSKARPKASCAATKSRLENISIITNQVIMGSSRVWFLFIIKQNFTMLSLLCRMSKTTTNSHHSCRLQMFIISKQKFNISFRLFLSLTANN